MVAKKFTATKKVKGRLYQYFRKDGVYVRLPDDVDSEEYDREYWALLRGKSPKMTKTTFDALIVSYKKSPRFLDIKPSTRKSYDRYLQYIHEKAGSRDATKFMRQHAIDVQQANSDRPRTANYIVTVLGVLFEYAIDLGWRADNPAKGVRKLTTGEGHKPWPEWAMSAFRKHSTPESLLLFELGLGTGQRAGDLIKMKWNDYDGEGIKVKQGKTGTDLWVPCTETLLAALKTAPRLGIYILTNAQGQPLTYSGASQRMTRTSKKAGTTDYTMHGLRYSAASLLAEMGATDAQISAITGHKSRQMVAKYASGAKQIRLASEVVKLRERNKNKT